MPDDTTTTKPRLPLTIAEYMALHNMSRPVVRRLMAQGRLPFERRGGGVSRAGTVLILTDKRPDRAPPGGLSTEQRAAWNKGRR